MGHLSAVTTASTDGKTHSVLLLAFLPHKQAANKQDEHHDDEHDESIHNYSFRSDPSRNELSRKQHTP